MIKVKGQFIQRQEWKQTDGRTDGRTDTTENITFSANAVGFMDDRLLNPAFNITSDGA